jgi:hypothetical protein
MSRKPDGFHSLAENFGEGKIFPLPGFEPRTVQPLTFRCIYCAVLAPATYNRLYYLWEYS